MAAVEHPPLFHHQPRDADAAAYRVAHGDRLSSLSLHAVVHAVGDSIRGRRPASALRMVLLALSRRR